MSLQHILLGLLNDRPGSGYDLNKRLQSEGQHFWMTDQSQIYRALYKMQAEEWVRYETVIQQDSPNKKVYYITETGRAELKAWLHEDTVENPPAYLWLAKLYLGRDLDVDKMQHIILQRLEQVRQYKQWAQSSRHELANGTNGHRIYAVRLMTFDYNLQILDAEIEWLEEQLNSIRQLETY
ncbi:MAG: PadR family transcriptional regulator [Chloroflexota bacterium]